MAAKMKPAVSFYDEDEEEETKSLEEGQSDEADDLHQSNHVDTRRVNCSKKLVYLVLALAATGVSLATYFFMENQEEETLRVSFEAYSGEILKQAQANAADMFRELSDLSKDITSHALTNGLVWPNVTLPHFDVRTRNFTTSTVGFAPFVTPENHDGWEAYAVENQGWIAQDYFYRGWTDRMLGEIPTHIHYMNRSQALDVTDVYEDPQFQYEIPLWQLAPPRTDLSIFNLDLSTIGVMGHLLWDVRVKKVQQYGRVMDFSILNEDQEVKDNPTGSMYQPVFQDFNADAEVVGFTMGLLEWDNIFKDVLYDSSEPILVEIEGTCNARFTYRVVAGEEVKFLGYGEGYRDPKLYKYKQTADLLDPLNSRPGYPPVPHTHRDTDAPHGASHCTYFLNSFPTREFTKARRTKEPLIFALFTAGVFVFTTGVFFVYDSVFVRRRQMRLLSAAKNTNAILASMFPKDIQRRILNEVKKKAEQESNRKKNDKKSAFASKSSRMTDFLNNEGDAEDNMRSDNKPMADLFPSATIMFADIVGFTAWSSTREPDQVFTLLETLYSVFDKIAKRRGVFKVETIGDCYVAVAGLPVEREDHAVVMARFAINCLHKLQSELLRLEKMLGPDTATLGMRIGLHSGAVTAGVLRGDRARFQLFGDAVNTAARIETTGEKNRVHISEQTAELLVEAGKEKWIQEREDQVEAKGKGTLKTFWLTGESEDTSSSAPSRISDSNDSKVGYGNENTTQPELNTIRGMTSKDLRLVEWNVEVLRRALGKIQLQRKQSDPTHNEASSTVRLLEETYCQGNDGVIKEVRDVISFPSPDRKQRIEMGNAEDFKLPQVIEDELRQYVAAIASLYEKNPFHSFEHASHVTMSTCKLLSRVVESEPSALDGSATASPATIIKADPLTQFALILSAIIHDASHPGVPNTTLVQEECALAKAYENKSVAEQQSCVLCFVLLMQEEFQNLRKAIYTNQTELERFRAVVVNAVMATDVMDKQLGADRKARWERAFSQSHQGESREVEVNRKTTIVLEHLIQASDVSHTMQHWHVYSKWNECLFKEMMQAYQQGRSEKSPASFWYIGELRFLDYYVIPLAKKLSDCGVFGVSSDEYLDYALRNRKEWESRGQEIVASLVEKYGGGSGGGQ